MTDAGSGAGISASAKTEVSATGSIATSACGPDSVDTATSPSAAGFFFSGFGGLGDGFLAVSNLPSANSKT